jgi:N-acyl-D-aspartate/D-glutamate deacylase
LIPPAEWSPPGIVDIHAHYNGQLFWDPWRMMSGWHGVTTVVLGNYGFGLVRV